jgi:RNA polymerase sigma-70 factor (ECF subfamily)
MTTSAQFPTTHWSLVAQAGGRTGDAKRRALTALLLQYLPPLRAYLIYAKGYDVHGTEDLLQSFVADRVLEQDLFRLAEQGRGRFRAFVLTSLDHFASNKKRHGTAKKRKPQGTRPVEDALLIPDYHASPSQIFDLAWSRQLIGDALQMMERECSRSRPELWKIFEARVLCPAMNNDPPMPYAQMVKEYGFASPSQAANAVVTANRMFGRMLRAVIGRYEKGPDEIEEEVRQLRVTFASLTARERPRRD